jgi:hypothetical protein
MSGMKMAPDASSLIQSSDIRGKNTQTKNKNEIPEIDKLTGKFSW